MHLVALIYTANPLKVHKSGVLPAKMQAVLGLEDFKRNMDFALRGLHFHGLKKGGGRVPTHNHHLLHNGQTHAPTNIHSEGMSHIWPDNFHNCSNVFREMWACFCFLV